MLVIAGFTVHAALSLPGQQTMTYSIMPLMIRYLRNAVGVSEHVDSLLSIHGSRDIESKLAVLSSPAWQVIMIELDQSGHCRFCCAHGIIDTKTTYDNLFTKAIRHAQISGPSL